MTGVQIQKLNCSQANMDLEVSSVCEGVIEKLV